MVKSKNKKAVGDSQTPQPQKKKFGKLGNKPKTPKSEPPAKSKKISEEISDEEFEQLIKDVRKEELIKEKLGKRTPKPKSPKKGGSEEDESDDESSDEDFDLGDVTFGDDDDNDDSDEDDDDSGDEEDDDEDDDDDDDESDENSGKVNGVNKDMAKKLKALINSQDGFDSDDDSDEDDDEDEDDDDNDDEDDDGDDDDDDDSDEMKEEAPPSKKAKQQKVVKKEVAEDSDDEENDDEDDNDEEDESDEDDTPPAKKAKKQETKAEKNTSEKEAKSKKRKAEDCGDKPAAKVSKDDLMKDQKTMEELNSRTLMVKDLGENVKKDDLRELLPKPMQSKLTDIRISSHHRRKKGKGNAKKMVSAYLEFNTEQQADKAYEKLKQSKLNDKPVVVDYVGKKSVNKPEHKSGAMTTDPDDYDPLRLFIGSLDRWSTTEEAIRKHFPTATKIQVPKFRGSNKLTGYAFAHYSSEAACKKAHDEKQNLIIADKKVRVLFAKKTTEAKKADNRPQMLQAKALAMKAKSEKKAEKKDKAEKQKKQDKQEKGKKKGKKAKVQKPESSDSDDSDSD